jgi:hypothetical protein
MMVRIESGSVKAFSAGGAQEPLRMGEGALRRTENKRFVPVFAVAARRIHLR